jgi:hypothetical protein
MTVRTAWKLHSLYFVSTTGVGKYYKDMILSIQRTVQESVLWQFKGRGSHREFSLFILGN